MNLHIFGHTKDLRTNTYVVYAHISIDDYLALVGNDFDKSPFQRKREKHKGYQRMKQDIIQGAVLPPITLSLKANLVDNVEKLISENNLEGVKSELSKSNQLFILDGLQRTHILNDLKNEGTAFKDGQKLLLEFWIEKETKHLIYRFIILNSGQKTMSLRHQLETLYGAISNEIESEIPEIELNEEKDEKKRRKSKIYSFESIITAYYCFLTKNYQPNKENMITQKIQEESIIEVSENELSAKTDLFKTYLKLYADIDDEIFNLYNREDRKFIHWFAKENVMSAFFAALADYGNNSPEKKARILVALTNLKDSFNSQTDPLGLVKFDEITNLTITPSKKNIGLATKKILFDGFREYFMNSGEKSFEDCWITVGR